MSPPPPAELVPNFDEFHKLLGALPATDLPIALLPVRLETRFIPAGNDLDFCLRIYPDDVHIDAHETDLIEDEVELGRHFWEQMWRAAGDEARRKAAWAQLAQRFGPERAAWVLRATRPTNPTDRPAQSIPDGHPFTKPPQFPNVTTKPESWMRPPLVRALPNRWAVFGYLEGQRSLFTWGEQIPPELNAGPSPNSPVKEFADDQLAVDPGMQWLVDLDEAVRVGMAVRVRLTADEAARGYDELLVVGFRTSLDGASGSSHLAQLLEAQRFTDGLGFLLQGTPTNNTPNAPSGFQSKDPGFEESYGTEVSGADVARRSLDNASVVSLALGVNIATFSQIAGSDIREQVDARAMNIALWPATWGYFLEQMMGDTVSVEQLRTVRGFFIEHVRARGPVPALRIGRQPYGVLPASSLDQWQSDTPDAVSTIAQVLRALRDRWRHALKQVPRIGSANNPDAADRDLLDILALEPVSSGFQARSVLDGILFGTDAIPQVPRRLPDHVTPRRQALTAALSALGFTWRPRLLNNVFLWHTWPLSEVIVQGGNSDPLTKLEPNYIEWLHGADFASIWGEVNLPRQTGAKIDSLLYLLLRHSILLAYADTAHRILLGDEKVSTLKRPEPTLTGVLNTHASDGLLKMMETEAPSLKGARVGERIHTLTGTEHPAAGDLDDLRSGLSWLGSRTIGELELLLCEVLDTCSHRLDAWITALASERLATMRKAKPEGLLIGGYGWVQNVKPDTSRMPMATPPGETGRVLTDADSGGFIHVPSLNQAATAAVLRAGYLANRTNQNDQPFAVDLSSARVRHAEWLLDGIRHGQALGALLGYRFERGLHENHPGIELDVFIETFRQIAPLGEIYRARGEKNEARERAARLTADADARRAEADHIEQQASLLVAERQDAHQRATDELSATQEQIEAWKEELRKFKFPPDPDDPARQTAIRKAIADAEKRVAQLNKNIPELKRLRDEAIAAQETANDSAAVLRSEEGELRRQADQQNQRAAAAQTRELDLLAQRRAALLLPSGADITAMESIEAENVVDGLALQRRYQKAVEAVPGPRWDYDTIPFGKLGLPPADSTQGQVIVNELRVLDDSIDAVSDAVTAESVHQALLGNSMRARATLDAVAGGETPPPELDIVRTPRTGTAVTNRLLTLLPEPPPGGGKWTVNALQARAIAEPRVNIWASLLLGDPRRVLCRAEYVVEEAVVAASELPLHVLAISPLDLFWMVQGGGSGGESLLEQRLRYELLRRRPQGVPPTAVVRLKPGRDASWSLEQLSIDEITQVARATSDVVSGSRALDARDLEPPESAGAAAIDVNELVTRVDKLVAAFEAAHSQLDTLLSNASGASAEQVRTALLALTYFDVSSVPVNAAGTTAADLQALLDQAEAVRAETAKHVRQLQEPVAAAEPATLDPIKRFDFERGRAALVLGKAFRIVPRFKPSNADALNQVLPARDKLLNGDRLAPLSWLKQIARVRAGGEKLNDLLTYGQCVSPNIQPDLRVLQLPFEEGDRWTALPFGPDGKPPAATLSLVLHVPAGLEQPLPSDMAGLMIDEWVDVTPQPKEQTAIAFNYDAPGSRPPQAILLAVPPGDRKAWDIETLESIVNETLELTKLRTVRAADLDKDVTHLLPALYFGLNLAGDTVSTDFLRAAATEAG